MGEEFSLLEMRRVHKLALEVGIASSFGTDARGPPPNYDTSTSTSPLFQTSWGRPNQLGSAIERRNPGELEAFAPELPEEEKSSPRRLIFYHGDGA